MNSVTAWSPSRLGTYEHCPRKFKYKFVDRLPDEVGPAFDRGTRIHDLAKKYIANEIPHLPVELEPVQNWIDWLRYEYTKGFVKLELEIALTKTWEITHWKDWKNCWLRVKIDALHLAPDGLATVIDWKSGKFNPKPEYNDAVKIYATTVLNTELAAAVESKLIFTDTGDVYPFQSEKPIGLVELNSLKAYWEDRVTPMFVDEIFATKPSYLCRYCSYSKGNGGKCEY